MEKDVGNRVEEKLQQWGSRAAAFYDARWKLLVVLIWLGFSAWSLFDRRNAIHWFALGDTDDNLRMAQVRAWMNGQGWYDLVQHRFDPVHGGANIHWSRIVDLPIAGLITLFKPFVGTFEAEKLAAATAPLIPLLLMMFAIALIARRLVTPRAWGLALVALMFAPQTLGMFAPLRIDHHGWQLALLMLGISGLADPKRIRGGVITGLSAGLSLAIGMEMVIYLAVMGVATVLMWVADRDERSRLAAYAASLAASTSLGFLIFASYANRLPVCDALSPVWLSDAALASALMLGLAWWKLDSWKARFGVALAAGLIIAGFHAVAWPNCLTRLEGVSDEANRLWLSHVREARPVYRHGWRTALASISLPLTALFGWALLLWRARKEKAERPTEFARILAVAAPATVAFALLFWQIRAGPAAQAMAAPGAVAIAALFAFKWLDSPKKWLHVAAVFALLGGMGALIPVGVMLYPDEPAKPSSKLVNKANSRCPSLPVMQSLDKQPKGVVFTFIDLGPRIINTTHHDAIGGPYHRNYRAIVDVMNAFRGDEAQAHRIIRAYGSDYLLICPNMSTATIFMSEAPKGFYGQLQGGKVPNWLQPVDLGKDSPLKMWKVVD